MSNSITVKNVKLSNAAMLGKACELSGCPQPEPVKDAYVGIGPRRSGLRIQPKGWDRYANLVVDEEGAVHCDVDHMRGDRQKSFHELSQNYSRVVGRHIAQKKRMRVIETTDADGTVRLKARGKF